MIQVFVKDKELQYQGVSFHADFKKLVTEFHITNPIPIMSEITVKDDSFSTELMPFGWLQLSDKQVTSIFVHKNYLDLSTKVFEPVMGEFTFEAMCQNQGISVTRNKNSQSHYWEIPAFRYPEFIKYVMDRIDIVDGGGCLMTIGLDGNLLLIDPNTALSANKQVKLIGQIKSQSKDVSWMNRYPGEIELTQQFIDSEETNTYTFKENYLTQKITEFITNDKLAYETELIYRNRFLRMYYTATQLRIRTQDGVWLAPGTPVTINEFDDVYFVVSSELFANGECEFYVAGKP